LTGGPEPVKGNPKPYVGNVVDINLNAEYAAVQLSSGQLQLHVVCVCACACPVCIKLPVVCVYVLSFFFVFFILFFFCFCPFSQTRFVLSCESSCYIIKDVPAHCFKKKLIYHFCSRSFSLSRSLSLSLSLSTSLSIICRSPLLPLPLVVSLIPLLVSSWMPRLPPVRQRRVFFPMRCAREYV